MRQSEWRPYRRAAREDTLLAPHAAYLRQRAVEVGYSAQVLFQELRRQHYRGSAPHQREGATLHSDGLP